MREPIRIVRWEDLSPNQQRVLTSAMEYQNLGRVFRDWQANEDRVYNGGLNNRGRLYAEALIPAAVELIRMRMIGLVSQGPDFRQLAEEEALTVVQDINNWWRYEAIPGLEDPLEPSLAPGGFIVSDWWDSEFSLKQINRDRFRLASWSLPRRMESPLI